MAGFGVSQEARSSRKGNLCTREQMVEVLCTLQLEYQFLWHASCDDNDTREKQMRQAIPELSHNGSL